MVVKPILCYCVCMWRVFASLVAYIYYIYINIYKKEDSTTPIKLHSNKLCICMHNERYQQLNIYIVLFAQYPNQTYMVETLIALCHSFILGSARVQLCM